MSGSPKNIQRDGTHINWGANVAWGLPYQLGTDGTMNANLNVVNTHSAVYSAGVATVPAGDACTIGVLMEPPARDRNPYRIKGHLIKGSEKVTGAITIGWANENPSGANLVINSTKHLGFDRYFDDLIIVDPAPAEFEGRLFMVGITIIPDQPLTDDEVVAVLSCQNLGTRPPTMSNAVP